MTIGSQMKINLFLGMAFLLLCGMSNCGKGENSVTLTVAGRFYWPVQDSVELIKNEQSSVYFLPENQSSNRRIALENTIKEAEDYLQLAMKISSNSEETLQKQAEYIESSQRELRLLNLYSNSYLNFDPLNDDQVAWMNFEHTIKVCIIWITKLTGGDIFEMPCKPVSKFEVSTAGLFSFDLIVVAKEFKSENKNISTITGFKVKFSDTNQNQYGEAISKEFGVTPIDLNKLIDPLAYENQQTGFSVGNIFYYNEEYQAPLLPAVVTDENDTIIEHPYPHGPKHQGHHRDTFGLSDGS